MQGHSDTWYCVLPSLQNVPLFVLCPSEEFQIYVEVDNFMWDLYHNPRLMLTSTSLVD